MKQSFSALSELCVNPLRTLRLMDFDLSKMAKPGDVNSLFPDKILMFIF
jgi:hypothetical protein